MGKVNDVRGPEVPLDQLDVFAGDTVDACVFADGVLYPIIRSDKRRLNSKYKYCVFAKNKSCVTCGCTINKIVIMSSPGINGVIKHRLVCWSNDIEMTVDHIIPKSVSGSDRLDNLQTMCMVCNNAKGARLSPPKSSMEYYRLKLAHARQHKCLGTLRSCCAFARQATVDKTHPSEDMLLFFQDILATVETIYAKTNPNRMQGVRVCEPEMPKNSEGN